MAHQHFGIFREERWRWNRRHNRHSKEDHTRQRYHSHKQLCMRSFEVRLWIKTCLQWNIVQWLTDITKLSRALIYHPNHSWPYRFIGIIRIALQCYWFNHLTHMTPLSYLLLSLFRLCPFCNTLQNRTLISTHPFTTHIFLVLSPFTMLLNHAPAFLKWHWVKKKNINIYIYILVCVCGKNLDHF